MASLTDEVITIIRDVCHPSTPDLEDLSRPLLTCGLDSLDFAGVIMALEEKYGVTIKEEDTDKLSSVDAILNFLDGSIE